jgi:AcrR family transcriptional regulator
MLQVDESGAGDAQRPQPGRPANPRRQQVRRAATEAAIIRAFDHLLAEGGIDALGINALCKEARVGKKQVYDYFGGLHGVAEAWVRAAPIWQSLEDLLGEPMAVFRERPPASKLAHANLRYAAALRGNPRLCELLSGEFVPSGEVKFAVDHVRQLIRADFEAILQSDDRLRHPDFLAYNLVAYACSTYLGLRAHHQPVFFGFDLSAETSWAAIMAMFERVLTLADPDRRPEN